MKIQDLQSGDLLFTADQSDIAQAIKAATGKYNHVAIYLAGEVYHATGEDGVIKQDLAAFLADEDQSVFVYRYPQIDTQAVYLEAQKHLGKPYNVSFYPTAQAFYCSQYITAILPIFETIPMQFGDEEKPVSDFWQAYYDDLGLAVPLNQAGTNPSQLARSERLVYVGELDD